MGNTGYKLWYCGKYNRKGVGNIVEPGHIDKVVELMRIGDRKIATKLVWGKERINVISAYALQIGLDAVAKAKFWEDIT